MPNVSPVANRPAEVGGGLAGAIAALLVAVFHIDDPSVVAPLILVLGAVPGAITFLVRAFRKPEAGG